MSSQRGGRPYLIINRALNKSPTLWIFPPGMLYALGIGFFLSFIFLVLLFQAPWWLVFLFWCWVSIVYYAVVGEKPWKFAHKIKPPPQWTRANRPISPLLHRSPQHLKNNVEEGGQRFPQTQRQNF
jgi:hypothetical protein